MNIISIREYIEKRRTLYLPVSSNTLIDVTGIEGEWQFLLYLRIFNDTNVIVRENTYTLSPGIYLVMLNNETQTVYSVLSLPLFSDEQLTCFDLCYLRRLVLEQDPIEAAALCQFECS